MKVDQVFISRGCNEKQDCFVVSNPNKDGNAFIVYASGIDVVVANSATSEVEYILQNHEQEINCLCLCPNLANGYYSSFISMQNEIISCGCDGSITVWRYSDNQWINAESFSVTGLIESVSCFAISDTESLLFVTTDQRTLSIFYRSTYQEAWSLLLHTTSPHSDIYYTAVGCLPLIASQASASTPCTSVLVFLCGTDHHIEVNELSLPSKSLQKLCILTGFENWISSIQFHYTFDENNMILDWSVIAAGQDGRCRIWKIAKSLDNSLTHLSTNNHSIITIQQQTYVITLESVIEMSNTILSCVKPYPIRFIDGRFIQYYFLLSSSLDGTLRIYAPDDLIHGTGVFNAIITLQPHLIGSQGFWSGCWLVNDSSRSIYAVGYHSAFFHYHEENISNEQSIGTFSLKPFLSGHFGPCRVSFTHYGNMLLSSSYDRTVRIWGRELTNLHHWEEVCRPVIHGYPVTGVVSIKNHVSLKNCCDLTCNELGRLVTINEEKKSRVFNPTLLNMITLNTLVDNVDSQQYQGHVKIEDLSSSLYWSSFAPELGLSNKGIPLEQAQSTLARFQLDVDSNKGMMMVTTQEEKAVVDDEEGGGGDAMLLMANDGELELLVSLDHLQTINNKGSNTLNESRLCKGMLMNESTYLYNSYTINNFIAISCDYDHDFIFTTTIGSDENDSIITVWSNRDCDDENENLKRIQYLKGHRSTIVSLTPFTFNHCHYLISAGKDRQLRIWKNAEGNEYMNCATVMKSHARIIWCSCMVLQENDDFVVFATGSRDMKVKLWKFDKESNIQELTTIECIDAVKAIGCSAMNKKLEDGYETMLTIGLENGDVIFDKIVFNSSLEKIDVYEESQLHLRKPISTIDWLPLQKEPNVNRSYEEYYGNSNGNVVIGCENGGIYLYYVHNE